MDTEVRAMDLSLKPKFPQKAGLRKFSGQVISRSVDMKGVLISALDYGRHVNEEQVYAHKIVLLKAPQGSIKAAYSKARTRPH